MQKASKLLRIYTDESAFFGDQRVFEFISELARQHKLAGVTVLEAVLGFGDHDVLLLHFRWFNPNRVSSRRSRNWMMQFCN